VVGGKIGGQLGSQVLPFGEGMSPPKKLAGSDIEYTREARAAGVSGVMLVRCTINTSGEIEDCKIIKPLPHMGASVLRALSTWRMTPVTFQGKPVSVSYLFTLKLRAPNG
jgi:protein TonB